MIHIKKISLCITLVVLTIMMGGCGPMSSKNEIRESFEEKLSIYPIKNLEDFYDKEGFRDSEFDENDKGTWILNSSIAVRESKDGDLNVKGMVLDINRNTKMSKGQYYYKTITEDSKGRIYKQEKNYPVKLENNKIVPLKPINDKKIRKEIEDFRFFVQYANFKDLNSYGQGHFDYNPNVPSYTAEYQLSNNDYNVKQLRKRYDISTNKAPKLILTGVGEFKGSSVGYKNLKMEFEQNEEKSTNFSDTVSYKPSRIEE
ncbi:MULTISPECIES: tandem-type lipoprotein [Staphylococcus]|uniref:Tandem-type lipoprotein n=1 Tax=Staphylococcus agnetis TaxID=985762 RepID=A0AAW9YVI9_9STAP|nr:MULTISPECIES: tandem-type lipoprotein [Staphylococcus]NHM92581.1 tandem-type lipoprotein [Staphylococcus sp. 10602379]NJI03737.1 tandem-type lipoprotein [Staphylococcus agnetis]